MAEHSPPPPGPKLSKTSSLPSKAKGPPTAAAGKSPSAPAATKGPPAPAAAASKGPPAPAGKGPPAAAAKGPPPPGPAGKGPPSAAAAASASSAKGPPPPGPAGKGPPSAAAKGPPPPGPAGKGPPSAAAKGPPPPGPAGKGPLSAAAAAAPKGAPATAKGPTAADATVASKGPPVVAALKIPSVDAPAAATQGSPGTAAAAVGVAADATTTASKTPIGGGTAPGVPVSSVPAASGGDTTTTTPAVPHVAVSTKKDDGIYSLQVSPIYDLEELSRWEYWLQLSLFTTDLHINAAWRLVSFEAENVFHKKAKDLQGPVVISLVDLDTLSPSQSGEEILHRETLHLDFGRTTFAVGQCMPPTGFIAAPMAKYYFLACKLALGKVFSFDTHEKKINQQQTETRQQQQWISDFAGSLWQAQHTKPQKQQQKEPNH